MTLAVGRFDSTRRDKRLRTTRRAPEVHPLVAFEQQKENQLAVHENVELTQSNCQKT
jgi:hypothetical protein